MRWLLPGALRVADIGLVATTAAEMAAVMPVVLVLLLTGGGVSAESVTRLLP